MLNIDDKKILIISLTVTLLFLIGGVKHFLGQWQYSEPGHGILVITYMLVCSVLFFAMRFIKVMQIILTILLLFLVIFYANKKFAWRQDYISVAKKGQPFILEEYIASYPTMEEHSFGWLWGEPAWVRFANDCVAPVLEGYTNVPSACINESTILKEYNIDIKATINQHLKKMQNTARRIEDGQLKDKRQYQTCLQQKQCAIIPLLPARVDPESIDRDSDAFLDVRQAFWSLINDKEITPSACHAMKLCRAMRDLSVISIGKPDIL